jgi:N-methylhydantoinase B
MTPAAGRCGWPLHAGEVVEFRTGGGGGYGEPLERDPERVRWEVLNEIIDTEQARDSYGVILATGPGGDPLVDLEATEACRAERRNED